MVSIVFLYCVIKNIHGTLQKSHNEKHSLLPVIYVIYWAVAHVREKNNEKRGDRKIYC